MQGGSERGRDNEDGPDPKLGKEGNGKVVVNASEAQGGSQRIVGAGLTGMSWKREAWESEWMQKTEIVECGYLVMSGSRVSP